MAVDAIGEAVFFGEGIVVVSGFVLVAAWHEIENEGGFFVLVAVVQPKVAKDAKDSGADEVHKEIAHGIGEADIQIAAVDKVNAAVGGGDLCLRDVFDAADVLRLLGIKVDTVDALQDGVLLHVETEEGVGAVFEKFPEHADGHRETEGDHAEVKRRERDAMAVTIEQVDHREPNSGSEKSVEGVKNRVPVGDGDVEMVELAENFRGEDKEIDDGFKRWRNFYFEALLEKRWYEEEQQREQADKGAVVVAVHDGAYQGGDDEQPQHGVKSKNARMLTDVHGDVVMKIADEF